MDTIFGHEKFSARNAARKRLSQAVPTRIQKGARVCGVDIRIWPNAISRFQPTWPSAGVAFRSMRQSANGGRFIVTLQKHRKREFMTQSIPIKPLRPEGVAVELRFRPIEKGRRKRQPSTTLKVVFCVLTLSVASGCMAFHNHVSARSWNQTVAQERQDHENPNETSIFGGN
jgi:hypothetical protein